MDTPLSTQVRVRFADVDAMGHVNNAKFFTYFEQARVKYFRQIPALDFTRLGAEPGVSVILASIRCDFQSPAYLDELLRVKIRMKEIRNSSFVFEYEITEETSGRKVALGESVQVYFDYQKKKSLEITEELRGEFERVEGRTI